MNIKIAKNWCESTLTLRDLICYTHSVTTFDTSRGLHNDNTYVPEAQFMKLKGREINKISSINRPKPIDIRLRILYTLRTQAHNMGDAIAYITDHIAHKG